MFCLFISRIETVAIETKKQRISSPKTENLVDETTTSSGDDKQCHLRRGCLVWYSKYHWTLRSRPPQLRNYFGDERKRASERERETELPEIVGFRQGIVCAHDAAIDSSEEVSHPGQRKDGEGRGDSGDCSGTRKESCELRVASWLFWHRWMAPPRGATSQEGPQP